MTEILLAIAMFTGVILLLVAVLMVARNKLVPAGDLSIVINDDPSKALTVAPGTTLLNALAAEKIFIPSACGGKGSCGVCDVVVKEGGGEILPTETGFISPKEARHGYRLACQLKVKRDMKIELSPEVFSVRKWQCRVISNRNVSTFIKELKLALPEGEDVQFRAGGYMQIEAPAYSMSFKEFDIEPEFREEWDKFDLWRFKSVVDAPVERAYSMANYPLEKGMLLFTIRIAFSPDYREDIPQGKMSSWLFNLKPGDMVTVSGPYGEFFARETNNEMCFVAAGAGEDALLAQDDVLHVRRVGYHGEEDIHLARHLRRAGAGDGAGREEGGQGLGAAGMDMERIPGLAQVERHGPAHDAEADEAKFVVPDLVVHEGSLRARAGQE